MTRSRTARVLAVTAYAVALLLWCWLVGIPNDPIGVALWLWLLAICWRLDWCWQFPKDWWPWLLALAVYGLARGVTDDIGFTPHEVWPIRADEWLAHLWGGDVVPTVSPAAPVLRRPVRPASARCGGTTSRPARRTPHTSWPGSPSPASSGFATAASSSGGSAAT